MERETQNAALGTCRSQWGVLAPILMSGYNEERASKDLWLCYNQALLSSLLHPAGRETEAWKKHTACYASWLMQGLGKQEAGKGVG